MIRNFIISFFSCILVCKAQNPFDITINYSGPSQFQSTFNNAESTWESIITGYIDGDSFFGGPAVNSLVINATMSNIDGAGGTLGQAGPTNGTTDASGFILTTAGTMEFDTSDFTSPTTFFENVVLHEMAHVLGLGTLWQNNGLYSPTGPTSTNPITGETVGRYTGANALAAYQQEFDPSATFVPVEKGGGGGTADGHWDEGDGGGTTGLTSNIFNEDMNGEVMTGWANGSLYISNVTRGSLQDLGYNTVMLPVPEPSVLMMSLLAFIPFSLHRRR